MKFIEEANSGVAKASYQKPMVVEFSILQTNGGMAGVFEFNVNGMNQSRKDQGTS